MTKRIDTDMGTMTLTGFLLARIAEDMAAAVMMPPHPTFVDRVIDRKHLLAECEAKRRIVEAADGTGHTGPWNGCGDDCEWRAIEWAVAQLAAVYADHPDYRDEWRP
jgi:hypothetical protein